MKSQNIDVGIADGIATLSLNRAPVNALTSAYLQEFAGCLKDLAADDDIRAVVVQSAFSVFSAGLDLKEAQGLSIDQQSEIVRAFDQTFFTAYGFPKPMIAAVDGAAIAGGLFFVLAADHRIGTSRAQFGLAEVRVGADFPAGPLEVARDTLAPPDFRRLLLRGRPYDADRALVAGIVDEIVAPNDLAGVVAKRAGEFAGLPRGAYRGIKSQMREPALERIRAAMAQRAAEGVEGWFYPDTLAAIQKMIGKA